MSEEKKKRINKKWQGLRVRCSAEDIAEIRRNAAAAGMTLSVYVRDYSLIPRTSPVLPAEIRRAISGFGRNLNQLAYRANAAQDSAAAGEIRELRKEVSRLLEALK